MHKFGPKAISSALLLSLLLSGCGEKSSCEIPVKHVHKYTKEVSDDVSIERYMLREYLTYFGWNWDEDYIEITDNDEKLFNVLDSRGLFKGENNWDYLYYTMANHHDYLEFYYEYDTTETYTTTNEDGEEIVETRVVHHDGWHSNPSDSNNTGRTRLYHHKYYGYRVIKNGEKYKLETSPLVDDVRDVIEEYPYFSERGYSTVYEEFDFDRHMLPNLSPDDFDIFTQPDLNNRNLVLSNNEKENNIKVYTK